MNKWNTDEYRINDNVLEWVNPGVLHDLELPKGAFTSIKSNVFRVVEGLYRVVVPEGVTHIYNHAFYRCEDLEEVVLPNSITEISANAFMMCPKLTKINLPKSLKKLGNGVFSKCTSLETVKLPNIEEVDDSLFSNTSLRKILIPSSVQRIGNYSFNGCDKLESVTISEGCKEIGICAFYGCNKLNKIVIPKTVESLWGGAFRQCSSLTEALIHSNKLDRIVMSTFSYCHNLERVITPYGTFYFNRDNGPELDEMGDEMDIRLDKVSFVPGMPDELKKSKKKQ